MGSLHSTQPVGSNKQGHQELVNNRLLADNDPADLCPETGHQPEHAVKQLDVCRRTRRSSSRLFAAHRWYTARRL